MFALWVGIWGYFIPSHVDKAIPWLVPPLHARFLGAMYLSAAAFNLGSILAHYYAEVRIVIRMIVIWTGMLLIVSLFYLGEFDYNHKPVWFWFGAYLVYPLIGLWLIWRERNMREKINAPNLPAWAKNYLLIQGMGTTVLSLFLLLVPEFMVSIWPWKITRILAQIYSAPFLSYGLSSLMLSRQEIWPQVRVPIMSTFVFAFGVLLASFIHRGLFSVASLSTWLWFGCFSVATLMLGLLTVRATQAGSLT